MQRFPGPRRSPPPLTAAAAGRGHRHKSSRFRGRRPSPRRKWRISLGAKHKKTRASTDVVVAGASLPSKLSTGAVAVSPSSERPKLSEDLAGVNDSGRDRTDGDPAFHGLPPHELIGLFFVDLAGLHQNVLRPLDPAEGPQGLVELIDPSAQPPFVKELGAGKRQAGENRVGREGAIKN